MRHYTYYEFESKDEDLKTFNQILRDMEHFLEGRLINLKVIDKFSMVEDNSSEQTITKEEN